MAKISLPAPDAQRIALSGAFYVRTWKGILIAQAWPRPRLRVRSLVQRAREEKFADVLWAIRFTDSAITATAIQTFSGTKLLWRDMLFANYFATLFAFTQLDQSLIAPLRFINLVSRALDKISGVPGSIPTRDEHGWESNHPQAAGTRLTSHGPGNAPAWE